MHLFKLLGFRSLATSLKIGKNPVYQVIIFLFQKLFFRETKSLPQFNLYL